MAAQFLWNGRNRESSTIGALVYRFFAGRPTFFATFFAVVAAR
jgi:hypothetical protein